MLLAQACGTKKGSSAKVSVVLAKAENALKLEGVDEWVTPVGLSLKPMAIRIGETNNGGYMIWGGKACAGEKHKKKMNDKEYEYFMENVCTSSDDNSYIDLTADIDAVNAEFNSQQWPVPPGNYNWVSMIMCGENETDNTGGNTASSTVNNWIYRAGTMAESKEVRLCSPFSYEMASPVVLGEGGSVILEVAYDLNKMINYYNSEAEPFTVDDSNRNENASYVYNEEGQGIGFYDPKIGVDTIKVSIK
jgi:hypothetical protein